MMNEKLAQQAIDYQRVEEAIHYLEANFRRQPNLEAMANSVHLSQCHFQPVPFAQQPVGQRSADGHLYAGGVDQNP
jgi:transcriptional regulator GlxA family with amidase domain